ncbi:hypothetical protein Mucpa_1687 [Mucilaginibacter paludis DSM 18603]|uniref:Uncharacterized protein n=1 Tax=Mucilaginibacter paludis DSM 18603 TaxID=714943 RepID=H1Y6J8_9SPHI|nr:hypothetical protein Mucpa_1687 [Mucilaginibacter paludis DSM 18603]
MATSTCVKCNNTSFEHKITNVGGKPFVFIQCSKCGGVIGVLNNYDLQSNIQEVKSKLDNLTP